MNKVSEQSNESAPRPAARGRLMNRAWRTFRLRPRLSIGLIAGAIVLVVTPAHYSGATRALVAWDAGAGLYVLLAWIMMVRGSVAHMRLRARVQDDGANAVLVLTVVAAVASLAAIAIELLGVKNLPPRVQGLHLALVAATVLCSWLVVHTTFALHYAHEFYAARRGAGAPLLQFPGEGEPDYWDFLYFSFVIGTTSQTADVNIASARIRRIALLHGVVTFLFNTTILAVTINIAAGLAT